MSNILLKLKDFSSLQAVTYTVNVVVAQKWCRVDMFLLQTTNMK